MLTIPPEKRPVFLGLAFALGALAVFQWQPNLYRDAAWSGLICGSAICLIEYERRIRRLNRPAPLLRWVGGGLIVVALVLLILSAT